MAYLKVQAQYNLAQSTIESKQKERFDEAVKYYEAFIDKYPQSAFFEKSGRNYTILVPKRSERIAKLEAEYKAARDKEKSNTAKVGAAEKQ
ncbi:MAG: hypothetical protein U5N85_11415 [Arcicella sp.]|nr:hypothetical protein [Arcicella sp.]